MVDAVVEWCTLWGGGADVTLDAQGLPTAACPACGDTWLLVPVTFDAETYEIAAWGTEAECYSCKTRLTACTPVDTVERMHERGDN
jgi:hypothetical protein